MAGRCLVGYLGIVVLGLSGWLGWMLFHPLAGSPASFPLEPVASNHSTVAGQLAGFAVAILLVFLSLRINERATAIREGRDHAVIPLPEDVEQSIVIILALAFFAFIATGVLYAITAGKDLPAELMSKAYSPKAVLTDPETGSVLRLAALVTLPTLTYYYGVVLLLLVLKPALILANQVRARWFVSWTATLTLIVGYLFVWETVWATNIHWLIPSVIFAISFLLMWSLDPWAQIAETIENRLIGVAAGAGLGGIIASSSVYAIAVSFRVGDVSRNK